MWVLNLHRWQQHRSDCTLIPLTTIQIWLYSHPADTLHSYSNNSDICHHAGDTFYFPLISACVHVVSFHVTTVSTSRSSLNVWPERSCFSAGYWQTYGDELSWYKQKEGLVTKLYTTHVCMYVCKYVCIMMYVCVYVCMNICKYVCIMMYVCVYVCMNICKYVWCIYVCM
jgi:hypothetical protein